MLEQPEYTNQEPPASIEDMAHEPDHDGPDQASQAIEDVQVAIDSRLRQSPRLTFFDDEEGDDDVQHEPDDIHVITGIMDRRGLPDFAKAAKYTGTWLGMVFKRGSMGLGYYRDDKKFTLCLTEHINAEADAAPVVLKLDEVAPRQPRPKIDGKQNRTHVLEGRERVPEGRAKELGWILNGPKMTL